MIYWAMWLVVVVLLAIIEASTVNLVSIWFVISGLVALIVSLFTDLFYLQFGIFVVLGTLLLILTKPMIKKINANKETKLNLERIIEMEGIVTSEINKNVIGEVKVDGKLWSAISNTKIPVNAIIKAKEIDGVKLVVEKVKEENANTEKKKTTSTKKKTTSSKKKSPAKKNSSKKVVKKES